MPPHATKPPARSRSAKRPPDPRVERSKQVIRRAAVEELADVGYGAFTIESVATRAGVGKSTIYRHWADKVSLIADAFETFHVQMVPDLEGIPVRKKVELLVRHVAEIMADSIFAECIPALIDGAERDIGLADFLHHYSDERRQGLVGVIAEGVATGELTLRISPDMAALLLLSPIFYRRLMSAEPFEPKGSAELVSAVLGRPRARR